MPRQIELNVGLENDNIGSMRQSRRRTENETAFKN